MKTHELLTVVVKIKKIISKQLMALPGHVQAVPFIDIVKTTNFLIRQLNLIPRGSTYTGSELFIITSGKYFAGTFNHHWLCC